jgi:hypothetical protein
VASDVGERQRLGGRIGGLRAWALNEPEVMVGPAHAGFRRRFERLVDPEGILSEGERAIRAERARRAHMLALAAKSAEVRRRKAAEKDEDAQ